MKKLVLPITVLCVLGLVACGPTTSSSAATSEPTPSTSATSAPSSTSEETKFTLDVTNKAALEKEWHLEDANDASRTIELSVTPKINIQEALTNDELVVNVVDSKVAMANGLVLTPKAVGTSEVKVTYKDKYSTSFNVNVIAAKEVEYKTLAEVKALAKGQKETEQAYTFKGVVTAKIGSSFFMQDETAGFYVYSKSDKGVAVGKEVAVTATLCEYYGLYETKTVKDVKVLGDKALPAATVVEKISDINVETMQSMLITLNGLTVTEIEYMEVGESVVVQAKKGEETISFKKDKYLDDEIEEAIHTKLYTLNPTDTVDLVNVPLNLYQGKGNPYLTSADSFTIHAGEVVAPTKVNVTGIPEGNKLAVGSMAELRATVAPETAGQFVTFALDEASKEFADLTGEGNLTAKAAGDINVTVASLRDPTVKEVVTIKAYENTPAPKVDQIVLTAEALGLGKYGDGSAVVNQNEFNYTNVGTYGNGIQVKVGSEIFNSREFGAKIKNIELKYAASKEVYKDFPEQFLFTFGNKLGQEGATSVLSLTKDVATYTVTPSAETFTFFKMAYNKDKTGTTYWDSITINFVK